MVETLSKYIFDLVLSIVSILKILLRSKILYRRSKIDEDYCFILGNGPSLKKDLKDNQEVFEKSNLLCVNAFSATEYYEVLKPKYYIFADPSIWSDNTKDPDAKKSISAMVDNLILKTSWDLNLFLPTTSQKHSKFIESIKANTNINISYFNTTPVEGTKRINWLLYKLGLGMPRPHNVIIPSLMVAINSNVKNIALFGVDHSWIPLIHVDKNNNALLRQEHFYSKSDTKAKHLKKLGEVRMMLHEMLLTYYNVFFAYVKIKRYADNRRVNIYNATENSFIDAFERKSIQELLVKIGMSSNSKSN